MTPNEIAKATGINPGFGFYDRLLGFDRFFTVPSERETRQVYLQVWKELESQDSGRGAYRPGILDCEWFAFALMVGVGRKMSERYPNEGEVSRTFGAVWGEWYDGGHAWNLAITDNGILHMNYGEIFYPEEIDFELEGGVFI